MKLAFAVFLIILPMQAVALSCVSWTVKDAFARASTSPETYLIVLGTLAFEQDAVPQTDWDNQHETPASTQIPARFVGKYMGAEGFQDSFAVDLSLIVNCAGPWCPSPKSGLQQLAFMRQSASGYQVITSACSSMIFAQPSQDMMDQINRCFENKTC
ncbi:MAG: hypothetical protein AB8B71_07695 [Paracoccaceae bacterium]